MTPDSIPEPGDIFRNTRSKDSSTYRYAYIIGVGKVIDRISMPNKIMVEYEILDKDGFVAHYNLETYVPIVRGEKLLKKGSRRYRKLLKDFEVGRVLSNL